MFSEQIIHNYVVDALMSNPSILIDQGLDVPLLQEIIARGISDETYSVKKECKLDPYGRADIVVSSMLPHVDDTATISEHTDFLVVEMKAERFTADNLGQLAKYCVGILEFMKFATNAAHPESEWKRAQAEITPTHQVLSFQNHASKEWHTYGYNVVGVGIGTQDSPDDDVRFLYHQTPFRVYAMGIDGTQGSIGFTNLARRTDLVHDHKVMKDGFEQLVKQL